MKQFYLFFAFLFTISFSSQSQVLRCGTMEHQKNIESTYPWIKENREKIEKNIQKVNSFVAQNKGASTVITIPVVFHVIWKTAAQNIPDASLLNQLAQLNADYARLNSDTGNTPAPFQSVAANTTIQFCLAQQDPNGLATTGIIRKQTTKTSFISDDKVKYTAQGGDDAWPASQYLNIWICRLGGGLLGYAQFPGGPAATDGVVFLFSSMGSIASPATAGAPYNLGRTATHEIGHWLNLYHINGDANCGDDLVSDTPTQDALHYGCFTAPYHVNQCSGQSPNGEMFMNYMDYTDDACMNMFTTGQKSRMLAAISTSRSSLLTSLGCQPPSTLSNDAGISAINSPSGVVCSSNVTPSVVLRNYGVSVLSSANISYQLDGGAINTYSWTGSLAQGTTATVALPSLTCSNGQHTLLVFTSNPNASSDPNNSNDTSSVAFTFASGSSMPISEGFENTTFPPTDWILSNPDNSTTWVKTTQAAKTGSNSIYIDNANYTSGNGQIDEISMSPLDLTSMPSPHLSFQVAYTYWTTPYQFSDTLEVLVSSDCGAQWTSVYKKFGNTLATAPGQGSDFIPTAAQWRLEDIDLSSFASVSSVIVKFRNISDYENNLYIDDINLYSLTGINNNLQESLFSLRPNPSNGKMTLDFVSKTIQSSHLDIYNSIGKLVYSTVLEAGISTFNLDLSFLPKGIYNAVLSNKVGKINRKILLN